MPFPQLRCSSKRAIPRTSASPIKAGPSGSPFAIPSTKVHRTRVARRRGCRHANIGGRPAGPQLSIPRAASKHDVDDPDPSAAR